jgi:hypothetical protein
MAAMLSSSRPLRAAAALLAALIVSAAAPAAQKPPAPLGGVERLKAWFNDNRSHPRAILLLSPT